MQYSSCEKCSFDAKKVMVFESTLEQAFYWKEIDPHFSENKSNQKSSHSKYVQRLQKPIKIPKRKRLSDFSFGAGNS